MVRHAHCAAVEAIVFGVVVELIETTGEAAIAIAEE